MPAPNLQKDLADTDRLVAPAFHESSRVFMKTITGYFRLWNDLRPAQRVGPGIGLFWWLVLVVILVWSMRKHGIPGVETFTWIALLHGALLSRLSVAWFHSPGLIPILPEAKKKSWVLSISDIFATAAVLTVLSTWAKSIAGEAAQPLGDFLLIASNGWLAWIVCYVGLRARFSEDIRSMIVSLLLVGGMIGDRNFDSPFLLLLVLAVGPVIVFPVSVANPSPGDSSIFSDKSPSKGITARIVEFYREQWTLLLPTSRSWPSFLIIILSFSGMMCLGVFVTRWLLGSTIRETYVFQMAVGAPISLFLLANFRESSLPGLMGWSRQRWARAHVLFRARIWSAWALAAVLCIATMESLRFLWKPSPELSESGIYSLVAWSLFFCFLLGTVRIFRYALLDPFRFRLSNKSRAWSFSTLKALGWHPAYPFLLIVYFLSMPSIIYLAYFGLAGSPETTDTYQSFALTMLVLSILSWGLSFRLQYRAILNRDLV